jgi:hypothetical protein
MSVSPAPPIVLHPEYQPAASVYSMPLEYHGCSPYSPRPCEPGILVRCSVCRHFWAPCTQTPVDMEAVVDGRWTCDALGLEDWL